MIRDTIWIAFRSLSQRKLRSWLTMIGIFIGIAAVVSLIGLGEGLRAAITGQFDFLGTDILSVQASGIGFAGPPGSGVTTPLSEDIVGKLEDVKGVQAVFGRIIESGVMELGDERQIAFIGSVVGGENRKSFEKVLNINLESGRLLRDSDAKGIIIGNDFSIAGKVFDKALTTQDSLVIEGKEFDIVGIIEKKGSFIFDSIILMNEDSLKDLIGDKGTYDVIAVQVQNENEIGSVKEDVEKTLRKERGVKVGEEDFQVDTPQNALESLNSTIFAVQLFVYIISAISLIVGGIGIMNTMYTSVLERTKEIGIMKSIGARNSHIFTLFFFESGFLGLVGGIIGVILGMILAYGLAFIGKFALGSNLIQANISPFLIIGSLSFSFILGTIFGVLPAIKASRLAPVDALRKG